MQLELVLQISMAALASLGTLLMGIGERSSFLPFIAILVAIVSVWVTDYLKVFRLNSSMANLAGLAAVVISLAGSYHDFRTSVAEEGMPDVLTWLMAVAHLLTYLQFILLFQTKNPRTYWLLITLSLLQVAVASALTLEVWFGLLLGVYLILAANTLSLFFLVREQQAYESPQSAVRRAPRASWVRKRWPLSGRPSHLRSSVQVDPGYGSVTWSFVRRLTSMVALTAVMTVALFAFVPRLSSGQVSSWGKPRGLDSVSLTGFSPDVEINSMGPLLESSEKVLRIRFEDPANGNAMQLANEPLLRGSVLTTYLEGRWSRAAVESEPRTLVHPPPEGQAVIKQIVDLEPIDTEVLFGVFPWAAVRPRADVQLQPTGPTLQRMVDAGGRRRMHSEFHYELFTWGVQHNRLPTSYDHLDLYRVARRTYVLAPGTLDENRYLALTQLPTRRGEVGLRFLRDIADELVTEPAYSFDDFRFASPAIVLAKARKLESYLRDSGRFGYSLKGGRRVNRNLDPIEDFLLHRKEGHCEYFASALALLLRAKGIPARVISGFHGGEWNEIGGFYQVRQFHAHSWVEAYLPPETHEDVPAGEWPEGGRWVVLDGTPASERAEIVSQQETAGYGSLKAYGDYMQYLWSSYVLGMDADKQRDSIYTPLSRGVTGLVTSLFDRDAWRRMFDDFFRRVASLDWSYFQGEWFNWRGGLVTMAFLWACVGAVRLARWFSGWLGRRRQAARAEGAQGHAQVEFYRRLELVLARLRLGRKRGQTPREFAVEAGGRLADQPERQPLAPLPRRIVEAFYRVRYGGQTLNPHDMAAVDTALMELEVRLAPDPRVDRARESGKNGK